MNIEDILEAITKGLLLVFGIVILIAIIVSPALILHYYNSQ